MKPPSDSEKAFLRLLLQTIRLARGNGQRWLTILPQLPSGDCGVPIRVPPDVFTPTEDDDAIDLTEIVVSDSGNTPPPSTGLPLALPPSGSGPTPTDDAIVEVLRKADVPLKRCAIAKRAGVNNGSYFADRLKTLCDQPPHEGYRVVRCDGHTYWLAKNGPIPSIS